MKNDIRQWMVMMIMLTLSTPSGLTFAQTANTGGDSISWSRPFIHKIGVEVRPGYVIPTHDFLRGNNEGLEPIENALSLHLQYAFESPAGTYSERIYGGAYQGVGLAWYTFGAPKKLGNPASLYLFQGARIARLTPQLSLNYEWNFGLSFGWKSYDPDYNSFNHVIGSSINAYLNTNFYLSWMLSNQFNLNYGITLSHFSNGNTDMPNAGLNTAGLKIGLAYYFNRKSLTSSPDLYRQPIPAFPRHISYDLVLFGSWRRKGVAIGDEQFASPDTYPVLGGYFAPMYNVGYKFRAGIAADIVYDGSANIYVPPYIVGTTAPIMKPSLDKQLALGLSARVEYVMPYFTVGLGLGTNVIHGGGDLKGYYQILSLKMDVARNSFLHIGYNLYNFHTPNYLMLGFGFRFHNLYPRVHR